MPYNNAILVVALLAQEWDDVACRCCTAFCNVLRMLSQYHLCMSCLSRDHGLHGFHVFSATEHCKCFITLALLILLGATLAGAQLVRGLRKVI